jgi:LysM repeat protein
VGEAPAAFSTPTAVPETEEPTTACKSPYTVQSGEWVYSIARKCGLDPDDIIAVNNLVAPFLLYPGDTLDLPGGGGDAPAEQPSSSTCDSPYTVKAGDWVYSIARACGLEPQDIINTNNLAYPYTIYPGDKLTLN